MKKITRNTFLKQSFQLGALALLSPVEECFNNNGTFQQIPEKPRPDNDLLKKLVAANDSQVADLLQSKLDNTRFSRRVGYEFAALSASYCAPGSKYYRSALIISALEKTVQLLLSSQAEDGTVNIANIESPPDTAFILEPVIAGAYLLAKAKFDALTKVNNDIKNFIVKAGNALTTGGVHTPNHRWVVCAALARLNALYPDKKYVTRIEEWLDEGVFIDEDGHFPERSQIYSNVEDDSFITIARLLNKPALFDFVRKNLDMTYYYMEPNGDLVTTDSRRQDQYMSKTIVSYYLHYRYLAIRDNNGMFSAIAKLIESMKGFEAEILNRSLFHFLENPLLQKGLPRQTELPVSFEKLFATSHLLRIRRTNTSMTLFGGVDWPLIIASGRSNSPDFFSFRKGNSILKYLRLSTNFFNLGYFYSEGLRKEGNKYLLNKKSEAPYYQPLPKPLRKADGDYPLTPSTDGRFWNKMDFQNRPASNIKTMETSVSCSEKDGAVEMTLSVTGQPGVQVVIELCFAEGGSLSGVAKEKDGSHFLERGMGSYEYGADTIHFGPGTLAHKFIKGLEGERYSTHFGTLKTDGVHVYMTGVTPFNHTLKFT